MARFDAKLGLAVDVLVLGDHPAAYLAAALLRHRGKPAKGAKPRPPLRVVHAPVPAAQPVDRLVVVNPALFDLHPLLAGLVRSVSTTPVHGLRFLADDAATAGEHRTAGAMAVVARYREVRDAVAAVAAAGGVESVPAPAAVHVGRVDEAGVDVTVGRHVLRARAVVLSDGLPAGPAAALGVPNGWGPDVVHRFTSLRCKSAKLLTLGDRAVMPMSLDLCGRLCWAWLVPGDGEFQLVVEQPTERPGGKPDVHLLGEWVAVLKRHGLVSAKFTFDPAAATAVDLPLAGALAQEGVANRTLLVGPAGGFISACGEDVYPGCWSALFAADVLRAALRQEHLQDALGDYRHLWRTTLGDYLRGPQQNLRLLLPLVYRNPAMTSRMAEAILLSKNVVR